MHSTNHTERIKISNQIKEWNTNRLDLFHITGPNEALEYGGVMRYFYQGDDLKYQTKCIRVKSSTPTIDVIDSLIVKFHPDIKKINKDKYALYENHGLEERKMRNNEHPLSVQLNWAVDDKDGKFILKNESRRRRSTDLTNHATLSNYGLSQSTSTLANGYDSQTLRTQSSAVYNNSSNFFSRRFSNSKKSKRKTKDAIEDAENAKRLAEEISGKPPESSFTRTISNPDDVMKRRRQKKLEFRLEQFSGVKGDGEIGGTLKIYGNSINPDIPYKTLLLSVNDTVERVLSETLDKYGVPTEDHKLYVLVQQNTPPREDKNRAHIEEIVLHYRDCPLGILVHSPPKRGSATFAVRKASKSDKFPISARVPPFSQSKEALPNNSNNKSKGHAENHRHVSLSSASVDENSETTAEYPRLRKLVIDADGSTYDEEDGVFSLSSLMTRQSKDHMSMNSSKLIKIGSQSSAVGPYPNILLSSKDHGDIRSVHCHIAAKMEPQNGSMRLHLVPTIDSSSKTPRPSVVFINQQKIDNSTRIGDGDIIQLGQSVIFRFEEFNEETEPTTIQSESEGSQNHLEDSSESINVSRLTAELPVTVKYKYQRGQKLVERIMKCSDEYAEKGCKELFSGSGRADSDNLDETFRLAPAYMMYLVMRAGLSDEQELGPLIDSIADGFHQAIEKDGNNVEKEIFWLSNTSELLHLLQQDSNLRNYSGAAQDVLAGAIEQAFFVVQQQFSQDFMILLPALLSEDDSDMDDNTQDDNIPCLDRASILTQQGSIDYPIQHLLQTLSLAFNLFHNCQVNVALTIQMFSQLFHLLNTWMFNSVLGEHANPDEHDTYSVPICQEWGSRLTRRLNRIRYWSEINGLEMAANCHLQKMYQVAELMEADKIDLNTFGEKCIGMVNLNGAQLQNLLINCQDYELPNAWVEVVVNTAIQLHDRDFNDSNDSRVVTQNKNTPSLYEDMDLRLPLLLPADGYCCDRGIVSCPTDLKSLLNSLKDILHYRLNPPILDQIDIRWKFYLGSYENTPTVSRSNTLLDQANMASLTSDAPSLPRNWVDNSVLSDDTSTTETISSPRERFQKKSTNIVSQSSQNSTSQMKHSLPISEKTISTQPNDYNGLLDNGTVKTESKDRFELKLTKINNSLGLSIIAAKAASNDIFRIYVKDVVAGGAGQNCGKISPGDQLVSIDGNLLEDMTQDEAVAFMKKTKSEVVVVIQKDAALRNGVLDAIRLAKSSKTNSVQQKAVRNLIISKEFVMKQPPSKPDTIPKTEKVKEEPNNRTNRSQPSVVAPSNSKVFQRPASRKISNQDSIEPEYTTLPLRENNTNRSSLAEGPVYGTVRKQSSSQVNCNSGPSNDVRPSKSYSQPNLNKIPMTSRGRESSSSGSCSSGSMSSTEEDESLKSQTDNDKRNSSSIYERIPYPNDEKKMAQVPIKAVSDVNISSKNLGIPRHEVTVSAMELRSNVPSKPLLMRPVLTQNSDPIISMSSQEESEPLSLNKPVLRDHSSTSESESESETISSNTESTSSSDPSPQPQKKLSSEPILSPRHISISKPSLTEVVSAKSEQLPESKGLPGVSNLGGFKKPIRLMTSKSNDQLTSLPFKDPVTSSKHPIVVPDAMESSKNKKAVDEKPATNIRNNSPGSIIQLPPPPPTTAFCPQYRPPSDLTEIDWNNDSGICPPRPALTEDEIKSRRKAMAKSIRQETEEREKKSQPIEIRPPASSEEKRPNERSSTQYGRPQFKENNQSNRPVSLFTPDPYVPHNPNDSESNFPSPPSSILCGGLVVPPSPVSKAKVASPSDNYRDPYNKTKSPAISANQGGVEELSFREKMKLFASKIGEDGVVERQKVSSKQRKIDSGDYS